jgi:hypothetical protein
VCRHCYARFEFERLLKDRIRASGIPKVSDELKERVKNILETY